MEEFVLCKEFKGKNLKSEIVDIPASTPLQRRGSFIVYNKAPLCVWNSQVAKDYCIWNGDGEYLKRFTYEKSILFDKREKIWTDIIPVYDNYGEFVEYKRITRVTRFSPGEEEFMRKTWPQLFEKDEVLRFNDYFFVGSHISEVKSVYDYLLG